MRIAEVMKTQVRTVSPAMWASDAWELMRRHGIHHLVVVDGRDIVGVLSERDGSGMRSKKAATGTQVAT